MRRPVVYIAGKFRDPSASQRLAHIANAQAMALAVARLGAAPISPHANLGHGFGQIEEAVAEACNMATLAACDALLLMTGWEASPGSRRERHEALRLGIPVLEVDLRAGLEPLKAWIAARL